jgi:ATP-binding cassette, subfamily B, bacterial MsbA
LKTYLRILSFGRPFSKFLPKYILFVLLAILFSIFTFGMLIPLLNILFGKDSLPVVNTLPEFSFSVSYIKEVFLYYFNDYLAKYGKAGGLVFVCVALLIPNLLANLFRYLSARTIGKTRARIVKNIRSALFDRVTGLQLGYFSNEKKGDIMSRITNDVQEVENTIVNSLKVIIKEPLTIIGFFAVLFYLSLKLTLFTFILLPVAGLIISGISKRLKKRAAKSQQTLGEMVSTLDESLGGIRVVKGFNAVGYIKKKFLSHNQQYADINVAMSNRYELAGPISEFLGIVTVTAILLYGGLLIINNNSELSGEAFIAYLAIFTQILNPAKAFSTAMSGINRGLASANRILELLDVQPKITDKPTATEIGSFTEKIEFRNVSFSYEKEKVLKNLNLVIEKGKTIALVGASGGGKSTLADLIPRFYDPTEGQVLIDGIDLRDLKQESLRNHMGIVTQESILFNDTVFNNIAFGVENAQLDAVIQAAKVAHADEFIVNLEKGYDTIIGDRGMKLSGGQKQRLSIARAVFKNPAILILDEATSALDSESEKLVQDALTNLMKNRTSVVIAHRLSTIQNADEIVVIQKGEIVERGNHEELISRQGVYHRLSRMQLL